MRLETIVLATANPHKVEELGAIFAGSGCTTRILTLQQACALRGAAMPPEPTETGRTFEENCAIKALAYGAALAMPCLADDSGLEVDALGGAPGVDSSHYAMLKGAQTKDAAKERSSRDAANLQLVLRELRGVPSAQRTARFVCVMALAFNGSIVTTARGTMEGRIGEEPDVPRGANGFGYDPIFLVGPTHQRSGAELLPQEKNALSHRGKAGAHLAAWLVGAPKHA